MTGGRTVGRLRKLCGNLATSSINMVGLARNTRPSHHGPPQTRVKVWIFWGSHDGVRLNDQPHHDHCHENVRSLQGSHWGRAIVTVRKPQPPMPDDSYAFENFLLDSTFTAVRPHPASSRNIQGTCLHMSIIHNLPW